MPILQLLNIPGLFPAIADVLAGYLFVRFSGAGAGSLEGLPLILGATICLHSAGSIWQQVFSAEEDRHHSPQRAIPAGILSLTSAFFLAAFFSIIGLLLAMTANALSFQIAAFILALFLIGAATGKRIELLHPLIRGIRRGMNLTLGMALFPVLLLMKPGSLFWAPPLLLGLYECLTSLLDGFWRPLRLQPDDAKDNHAPTSEKSVAPTEIPPDYPSLILGSLSLLCVVALAHCILPYRLWGTGLFLMAFLVTLPGWIRVFRYREAPDLHRLVKSCTLGILFLNAGIVATMCHASPTRMELAGIVLVTVMVLPSFLLLRRIVPE